MNIHSDFLTESYNYELPLDLISNTPAEPRDESRLMYIKREQNTVNHMVFKNLADILQGDELIVFNDTRVIPARLFGKKNKDGALIEVLLIREIETDTWLSLVKPGKRLKLGAKVFFDLDISAEVIDILENGERILKFSYDKNIKFLDLLKKVGNIPMPPYINAPQCEEERYQTVYSEKEGSVAAPTAGLHFTDRLLNELKSKGVKTAFITLHVGLGTFLPVKKADIREHNMHHEFYEMSSETAILLNEQLENKRKIIAVGTTVARTLETIMSKSNTFSDTSGYSDIFIYPGYKFKAVSSLITNFHLPESTLLMLVSAFWDRVKLMEVYQMAIKERYKFYSLGDAMLID